MSNSEDLFRLSPDIGTLLNRLFTLKEVYGESAVKFDEGVIRSELSKLNAEKDIFLKDFVNLMDFTVPEYRKHYKERIDNEKETLKIEFDHMMLEEDDSGILQHCIDLERGLLDQYDVLDRHMDGNQFDKMVVKNQAKETERSVRELEALRNEVK